MIRRLLVYRWQIPLDSSLLLNNTSGHCHLTIHPVRKKPYKGSDWTLLPVFMREKLPRLSNGRVQEE
jgi:hypothetical protein